VTLLGIYYIAPLTSLVQVLKERDSSSIYWPLSLANLANAMLWMVYGMVSQPQMAALL
jgi:solute carrier family 50 protein (sugar transporter)